MDEVNVHRQWRESVLAGQISSYQLKHSHNTFFLFYFLLYRRRARQEKGEKNNWKAYPGDPQHLHWKYLICTVLPRSGSFTI